MNDNQKISNLTVGELKDLISETVWNVLNQFAEEILANLPADEDFDDEDFYGDNGGE